MTTQPMTSITPPARSEAYPELTPETWSALTAYAVAEDVRAGDVLFAPGQSSYELILIERGAVRLVRPQGDGLPDAVVVEFGAGDFIGELSLLTGQATYLRAVVAEPGRVHRIAPEPFRRLMDEGTDVADLVLRAMLARRRQLQGGEAARSVEILGSALSAPAMALRTYAARQQLPHTWTDVDTDAGAVLAQALGARSDQLPVVVTPTGVLWRATPATLAERVGLAYRPVDGEVADLVVVGAGPAGLAAAVYGASEGLDTLVLEGVAAGGQAAASSRIENYLGFTSGISGADLTGRAAIQAQKFGARIASPSEVARLEVADGAFALVLADDTSIAARAVVIATGARYRALPLERWTDFEGAGIYYAATELEARTCGDRPVTVVGGANSAGQAALSLAGRGSLVTLAVRGEDLHAGMSSYLADRITAHPQITVRTSTEVTALHGDEHLDAITLRIGDDELTQDCRALFCFIGAASATDWLTGVAVDDHGFVLTDSDLDASRLGPVWEELGRRPLPFETSQPGVFAAGDVRAGSTKRVAGAVGEGASAVRSVHQVLARSGCDAARPAAPGVRRESRRSSPA
jgi:thioredoxin reductase (NADPH)